MSDSRVIFNGEPGETWTNETEKVRYQFHCSLINTCGTCLQYHMAIGPWWPIPIHRNCRCNQVPVKPGESSRPFVDFRELLDGMSHDQQVAAVGASNYKLLEAGIVKWDDVVTPSRVRDFREVVAKKRLTIARLEGAGVKPRQAKEAYAAVNTPEHVLIRQTRARLIEEIRGAGLSDKQIAEAAATGFASKVVLAREGEVQKLTRISGVKLPPDLIAAFARFAAVAPRPKEEPKPAPIPERKPGEPIAPDRPIEERIKLATHLDAKLKEILQVESEVKALWAKRKRLNQEWLEFREKAKARGDFGSIPGELDKLDKKLAANMAAINKATQSQGEKIRQVLEVPAYRRQPWHHYDGANWTEGSPVDQTRARARHFLESITAGEGIGEISIRWHSLKGVRANAHWKDKTIQVDPEGPVRTSIHEMGHHLEYRVPGAKEAADEFLKYRVGNQAPKRMAEVSPSGGYRPDELGRDDDFGKAFDQAEAYYVGTKRDGIGHSEIISMGVEKLYTDGVNFAKNDPEYCKFVLGILDGSLRKP